MKLIWRKANYKNCFWQAKLLIEKNLPIFLIVFEEQFFYDFYIVECYNQLGLKQLFGGEINEA